MHRRLRTVVLAAVLASGTAACSSAGGTTDLPAGPAAAASTTPTPTAGPSAAGDPVLAAYRTFWDAVIAANRAADPALPQLTTVAADPELSRVRDTVSRLRVPDRDVQLLFLEHRPLLQTGDGGSTLPAHLRQGSESPGLQKARVIATRRPPPCPLGPPGQCHTRGGDR